jgi:hypothetical protein
MSEGFFSRGFRGRRQKSEISGRLPPGQYLERGFPVLSAGPTLHTPLANWDFFALSGRSINQNAGAGRSFMLFQARL